MADNKMLTIHPSSFMETGSCDGPRYTRGQPSRETPGVIMDNLDDKYIAEFELPVRNIKRYRKEIQNNWDKLSDAQKKSLGTTMEHFTPSDDSCIMNMAKSSKHQLHGLFDALIKPTPDQRVKYGITVEDSKRVKEAMYDWNVKNCRVMLANWKTGLLLFLLLILVVGLIIGCAVNGDKLPLATPA